MRSTNVVSVLGKGADTAFRGPGRPLNGVADNLRPSGDFLNSYGLQANGAYLPLMQDDHQSDDKAERRTDWAEDRTDWAEDRTLLANERTFAGWMRTGLGSVGVALGLKAVFGAFDPTWAAKGIASIFVIVALVMFWSAERSARATHDRLCGHDASAQTPGHFRLIASIMAIGALGSGAILWML